MKSKLCSFAATFLLAALFPATAFCQQPGIPGTAAIPVMLDPTTGLPIQTGPKWDEANWKATNWQDPDIVLSNVVYDGLPLSQVARSLRDQFKEQFDIILPGPGSSVMYVNGQSIPAEQRDWQEEEQVQLHLKNVTASEIFGAMNLLFEDNRTPLRWELKVNGHRQIALLRVLVDPVPQNVAQPVQPTIHHVYFVGDLIRDDTHAGMNMDEIIQTVLDVWKMGNTGGGNIQFHKEAELLVVYGTPDQIAFVDQTLDALRQKVEMMRRNANKKGEAQAKSGAGGSGVAPDRKHE